MQLLLVSTLILFRVALSLELSSAPNTTHVTDRQAFSKLVEKIQGGVREFLDHREAALRARGEVIHCTSKNVVFRRE